MKKFLLALTGAAVLWAGMASAQYNVVDRNPNRNVVGSSMAGTYMADSTARLLRTDESGFLQVTDADRDRDFPVMLNAFQSVVLNAGTTYQPNSPIYVGQYSRAALMLTWSSAAADTDSVRIAVRVYGKKSLNSGNLYLWTPSAGIATADTCFTSGQVQADSSGIGRCMQPVSFFIAKPRHVGGFVVKGELANIYDGTFTTPAGKRVNIRKPTGTTWRPYLGTGAVMLNLSDASGNPCPFPYIFIEVSNLTIGANLTSVSCDIWPRVN